MKEFLLQFKKGFGVGLRRTERNPIDAEALVQSQGINSEDGTLHSVEDIRGNQIDLSSLNCTFPFPQVFAVMGTIIVCTPSAIYTYANKTLTSKISSLPVGTTWSCFDFGRYLVFMNGKTVVARDGAALTWGQVTNGSIPIGICGCNFNGQMIVGGISPNTGDMAAIDPPSSIVKADIISVKVDVQ